MKSLKENLPKNQGEFYVKYNSDNLPEYGFLVEGTLITSFLNFNHNLPKFIYLPDLSKKVEKYDFDEKNYDVNEVVDATLIHRNHNYLRGQVRLAKDCFKGVTDVTIVKTTEDSLYIDKECFDKDANISFIVPKNYELYNVLNKKGLDDLVIFPTIIDKNILNKINDHINYYSSSQTKWSIQEYNKNSYRNMANISIDNDVYVENDKLVFKNQQQEQNAEQNAEKEM